MSCINKIIFVAALVFCFPHNAMLYAYNVDEIKVYNSSNEIPADQGKLSVAFIDVKIPDGSYIYANPKGKGTGRPTEIIFEKNMFIKSWEVRYPEGEKYMSPGDSDYVYVYRKTARLPVAFVLKNNVPDGKYNLKVNVSILMCNSEACIPVERKIELPVKVKRGILSNNSTILENIGEFFSLKKNINGTSLNANLKRETITGSHETDIPSGIVFSPQYQGGEISGLLQAVIFGLIAGFILNFMPCVLPVVSLKIFSFVHNAGEKKTIIVKQGLLFSAGIITSFLVLAALASFSGHKWGGLFQERLFIIIMASFIFAMALSFLGVFTMSAPLSAGKLASKIHGVYADAFIKGAVATLLATPCSGPFLGGTLAWALTRPPEIIFIIFITMGIGMALPYMILALNPSLIRFIPAPGAWMGLFERIMGFILMFTVVYLAGILDGSSRMGLILFILFLSMGLWQYGQFGSIDKERWKRVVSFVMLFVIVLTGYFLSFRYFYTEKIAVHERIDFSSERILKNRDNGIITVVEFTAKWCPNCTLVEKLALNKEEVKKLFARENIEFMVADITFKNIQAESLMNRLGSKSIPLLVILPPGEGFSAPFCLRDLYSSGDVIRSLEKADKFIMK
jgi:thiol:disulfide interchange protein